MKILMINKFLYPKGGSETYIFKLGDYLQKCGHEVQYFGMEHEGRCVGNSVNAYTSSMDFHNGLKMTKVTYPIKLVYSNEARIKIRKVLDDFEPDVCHLNNFNYQLTPSIILEIVKWREQVHKKCKIIYTAHDYQLVCPNHMMYIPVTHVNCEKCLGNHFINCIIQRCIHGSRVRSIIGTIESVFWHWKGTYKYIDKIICCSDFMKNKLDIIPDFQTKTIALHNFIEGENFTTHTKKDYVLYFGRFSREKGVYTLSEACKRLPDIPFIVAGEGELEKELNDLPNVTNVGLKKGTELNQLICEAKFSICPSECYENCPFSVMESQERMTPVLGANIGGIPELISDGITGRLFRSGDIEDLVKIIEEMYYDDASLFQYSENCGKLQRDSLKEYCNKLLEIYVYENSYS